MHTKHRKSQLSLVNSLRKYTFKTSVCIQYHSVHTLSAYKKMKLSHILASLNVFSFSKTLFFFLPQQKIHFWPFVLENCSSTLLTAQSLHRWLMYMQLIKKKSTYQIYCICAKQLHNSSTYSKFIVFRALQIHCPGTGHMASPTKTWLLRYQLPNVDACHAAGTSILLESVRDKAHSIFNTVKWQTIDPFSFPLPVREDFPKGGKHSYAHEEHFHSDLKPARSKEHSRSIIWGNRN